MQTIQAPRTLREIAGLPMQAARLDESVLLVIDAQKEYLDGALPLPGLEAALQQLARLLERCREAGTPVIHVVQLGRRGSAICDPQGPFVAFLDPVKPRDDEVVVVKSLPSSFKRTTLGEEIRRTGRTHLIIAGFMTHMCVNSTTRDAAEAGYPCTVVAGACATRDLPDGRGGVIPADVVQAANLAALRDRFAVVVDGPDDLT